MLVNMVIAVHTKKKLLNSMAVTNDATNFKTQFGLIRKAITELPWVSPELNGCKPEPSCSPCDSSAQAKGSPRQRQLATALQGEVLKGSVSAFWNCNPFCCFRAGMTL